jgi:hypothetical protein
MRKFACLLAVSSIATPFLFAQEPAVVAPNDALVVEGMLKARKTPVWYPVAKDEGHGFAKKKNADFQFYSTILFLQRYMLGENAASAGSK